MKKETFKVMEKYHHELIEKLIDSFHFEKYREKQLEIDAIVKKGFYRIITVFLSLLIINS